MSKVEFIMSNLSYGANKIGIEFGNEVLKTDAELFSNQIKIVKTELQEENFNRKNLKYLNTIVDTCKKLSLLTEESIKNKKFPLVIGGDHSIALGSISGVAKQIKNLGVIWIDAHGDMNTHETTETGHIHGMPLSALMGLGAEELAGFLSKAKQINPENVVLFGVRDLDKKEEELIKANNIKVFSYSDIEKKGFNESLEEASKYLSSKVKKVHVSFDLDSINPELISGVSTPVVKGFSLEEGTVLINYLLENHNVTSMDIVEYNPLYDNNGRTLIYLKKLIEMIKEKVEKN